MLTQRLQLLLTQRLVPACLQLLIAERDSMRRRADELQSENAGLVRESEGRMEVIRTMMTKVWGGRGAEGVGTGRMEVIRMTQ